MNKFSLIFCLFSAKIFAQNPLSLEDAIKIGMQNNYKVQASQQQLGIAKLNQNVGVTERFPSISLDIGQNNLYNNNNSPTSFVKGIYGDNSLNTDINTNYTIYNGNQRNIKKNRLGFVEKQSEQYYRNERENVLKEIITTYYKVLIEKEKVQVLKETKGLSKLRLDDTKLQNKFGKASNYEILRAENSFLIDSSAYLQQENTYMSAMNRLNLALGSDKMTIYKLSGQLEVPKQELNFDALKSKMLAQNPEVQAKFIETLLNKNKIDLIKTQRSPVVRLNSRLGKNFSTTKFEGNPAIKGNVSNFIIGLGASIPIFNGGETKRAINEAIIENKVAELQLTDIKRQLSSDLNNAYIAYQSQLKSVKLNQQLIKNLGSSLQLVKGRLENGFSNALEYRTVQLEYVQSNFTYLESLFSLKSYETDIQKLVGELDKVY
jgi:outer membrane protein